jgi:hypothetical protein
MNIDHHHTHLEQFCNEKKLPPAMLNDLGINGRADGTISIPYKDQHGKFAFERIRNKPGRDPRFWYNKTEEAPIIPYGVWLPRDPLTALLISEGESDFLAATAAGFCAMAIPGASNCGCLRLEHLRGATSLVICQDADDGGERFVLGMHRHLVAIGYLGQFCVVRPPTNHPEWKDLGDWFAADPEGFPASFRSAVATARWHPVSSRSVEPIGEDPNEWPEPTAISSNVEPLPFPSAALPEPLARLIEAGSAVMNAPADYFGMAMLAVAGAAIGNSRCLRITGTHREPPLLYVGIVGEPGTKKSPVLSLITKPLREHEASNLADYKRRLADWKKIPKEDRSEKPACPRLVVGDATTEALAVRLENSPRGLLLYFEELRGLFAGMDQYKSRGNSRQFFLSAWSQAIATVDRKGPAGEGETYSFHNPFLAILGGLQPGVVKSLIEVRNGEAVDDGMLDRFLLVWPKIRLARGETFQEIDPKILASWSHTVERLLALKGSTDEQGRLAPVDVRLSEAACDAYRSWTNSHAAEQNADDFPEQLKGIWSKHVAQFGRIALIMQELRNSCLGESFSEVQPESVKSAVRIIDYLKSHVRRLHLGLNEPIEQRRARKIAEWIRRENLTRFTQRDAHRAIDRNAKSTVVDEALSILAKCNIARADAPEQQKTGRPRSGTWAVNPKFLAGNSGERLEVSGE